MAVKKTKGGHGRRGSARPSVGGGGRTSKTMGNKPSESEGWKGSEGSEEFSRTGSSMGETSGETTSGTSGEGSSGTSGRGEPSSGRYSLDCAEAGEGCSLKVSGTYDEVLSAGVAHGRSAHGMKGSDAEIGDDIKGYIKEDQPGSGLPGSYQGRGASQSGRSPGLPS